jgi:hypothetical protein
LLDAGEWAVAQYFFSSEERGGKTLCLAPLSDRLVAECGQEIPDSTGYFLFSREQVGDRENIEIIAHVPNDEAALHLRALVGLR